MIKTIDDMSLKYEKIICNTEREIAKYEDILHSEFAKGKFTLKHFHSKHNSADEFFNSKPIIVDGVSYRAVIIPQGWGADLGNYISVGVCSSKLPCLNLVESNSSEIYIYKMLHA